MFGAVNGRALLLVVLGLALGPFYYLYTTQYSGRQARQIELTERADRWTLPDGSIQRFRPGMAYRPLVLDLDPAHNDVRLRLTFQGASGQPSSGRHHYLASLLEMDFPLQQHELRIDVRSGQAVSAVLPDIAVHAPGPHLFVLQELSRDGADVASVTLFVDQDAERLRHPILVAGIAMLLAGLGWLIWGVYSPGRPGRA